MRADLIALAGAALVCTAVATGCHPLDSSMPMKRGARPLTMPDGEHQTTIGAGASFANLASPSEYRPLWRGYRYGLTDNLELWNLTGLAYRIRLGEHTELRLAAGFAGFAFREFPVDYTGDPRDESTKQESITFYQAGVTARRSLGNEVYLVAALRSGASYSALYGPRLDSTTGSAAFVYDGFGRLNVALPVSMIYGKNRDNREEITGGIIIGGFGSTTVGYPMLSYAATKQLDVFLAPALGISVSDASLGFGSSVGIDWHWD